MCSRLFVTHEWRRRDAYELAKLVCISSDSMQLKAERKHQSTYVDDTTQLLVLLCVQPVLRVVLFW
jgi:hypothetical protein